MRVRAKELGYYGHKRRRPGEVFDLIDDKDAKGGVIPAAKFFSEKWMEKVDDQDVTRTAIRDDRQDANAARQSVSAPAEAVPAEPVPEEHPHHPRHKKHSRKSEVI